MIYNITDTHIYTMPYYNITLSTTNPTQSATAGTINFSTNKYLGSKVYEVNMFEKNSDGTYKNNVQKYIDAYQTKLQGILGADKVTARIPVCIPTDKPYSYSYSDNGTAPYDICEKTVTALMRFPGDKAQCYWLGSTGPSYSGLYDVWDDGMRHNTTRYHTISDQMGVRPTVIFKK